MKAGWIKEPLGKLCEFQRGLTYSKGDEVEISGNVVLRATNIDLTTSLLNLSELKYISDKVVVPDSKKLKKDSLMICTASGSKSHLGKVAYIDKDYGYAFGGFMGMITPKKELMPKYLFYLMTSDDYKDFISRLSDGANINNLKFDDLKKYEVPHPSTSEQNRVVNILEKTLVGIAITKANAEKNLQNARALFESHLDSLFTKHGKDWRMEKLDNLTELARGHNPPKSKFSREQKPNYVRFYQIRDGASDNYAVYVPDTPQLHKMNKEDIMMVAYRHVGRAFRGVEGAFNVALCKIRNARRDLLDDDFLFHLIPSQYVKGELLKRSERSLIPSMSIEHLREIQIPLPPILEQKRLVKTIRNLTKETQQLESIYLKKINAIESLKMSLLYQAFNGNI